MDTKVIGAILLSGDRADVEGKHSRERTPLSEDIKYYIYDNFDAWRLVDDFDELMAAPAERVLLADTIEDLEQQIEARYPCGPKLSFVEKMDDYVNCYVHFTEDTQCGWGRRRRQYNGTQIKGWIVHRHPVVIDEFRPAELMEMCLEHGHVLINERSYYAKHLKKEGFVLREYGDKTLVNYNPKNLEVQHYKADKEEYLKAIIPDFPSDKLKNFAGAFSPGAWGSSHTKYYSVMEMDAERGSIRFIRLMIEITRKLCKKAAKPWRDYHHTYKYPDYVRALLPHVHFVEQEYKKAQPALDFDEQDTFDARTNMLWLCKFLRKEARALVIPMPEIPVAPIPPSKRNKPLKVKTRSRRAKRSSSVTTPATKAATESLVTKLVNAPAPQPAPEAVAA